MKNQSFLSRFHLSRLGKEKLIDMKISRNALYEKVKRLFQQKALFEMNMLGIGKKNNRQKSRSYQKLIIINDCYVVLNKY